MKHTSNAPARAKSTTPPVLDRWVAGILAAGIAMILLGILVVALLTRIPVTKIYVDQAGAATLTRAGIAVHGAADWPGAWRASPRYSQAAFTGMAHLTFKHQQQVTLPRQDILLWVYGR